MDGDILCLAYHSPKKEGRARSRSRRFKIAPKWVQKVEGPESWWFVTFRGSSIERLACIFGSDFAVLTGYYYTKKISDEIQLALNTGGAPFFVPPTYHNTTLGHQTLSAEPPFRSWPGSPECGKELRGSWPSLDGALAHKFGYPDVEAFKENGQKKFSLLLKGIFDMPSTRLLLINSNVFEAVKLASIKISAIGYERQLYLGLIVIYDA
ncbi:hypothetical protein OIDMADRAFT_34868 [Oidiodendron maius Zn]|uniref:Uncharacterized protein n=1 Tax=Oidiodendron maius (strain Zn) TaxID=913774 RepID=A0A0C3GSN3_OIDMZ|nr:hypothetical protein OIDMADRAFT_34868 [Oidiodendron maius Zn]